MIEIKNICITYIITYIILSIQMILLIQIITPYS